MTNHRKSRENNRTLSVQKDETPSLLRRVKNLLGAGPQLLLLGLLFESFTIFIRRWISFPVSISWRMQMILTTLCIVVFLAGMIWFHRSLNLIKVHLLANKRELITQGPFNYVRHPLYSTLLLTLPPLLIICLSDLLFIIPWVLILILSHYIVILEEKILIGIFGDKYQKYTRFVPPLLPLKGNGGRRYRKQYDTSC